MIDFIKRVLSERTDDSQEHAGNEQTHDVRIAACALFLEMANIDDEFSESERETIVSILTDEYELSVQHATELADAARQQLENSHDLWKFTNLINENFSEDEKLEVIELLWKIIYVDGTLDEHEDYLVHKLAKMLRLRHKQLIDAKLSVLYEKEEDET